ncbi:MAG: double-strand break repair protein AddB [Rhodobacteraceae bacterium]|nr:double-strand break repair protein AddB [Paracoccaceae bacterium]
MFEASEAPRVFSVAPGVDLPKALIKGLEERLAGQPAENWARTEIFVNTRRMQRRIMALFAKGPARLLPRIRTITDLGHEVAMVDLPAAVPSLRRRLELTQLVSRLLEQEPDLAPHTSLYDLADSLAGLMDEMQAEGVLPSALHSLDVEDLSGHWQRSLKFLEIVEHYFEEGGSNEPDSEARQRLVIEHVTESWQKNPPNHPIIVAGSTGSRGATALFMRAVACLPQGALVLPGFDADLPGAVWEKLLDPLTGEDHPQFRFARMLADVSLDPTEIPPWETSLTPARPQRNSLVSLAMRPAPVTDQWLCEGQGIKRAFIQDAVKDLTLIEASSPRMEAVAIALRLRKAVADGQQAALITPDRNLTRQVTAALDRWNIEPDDSAGRPLALSAPGRFLRHLSELFGQKLTSTALLTLLKHPICASTAIRGDHLRWTRDLELELLRRGLPFPTREDLLKWTETKHAGDQPRGDWVKWLTDLISRLEDTDKQTLSEILDRHLDLAEALAAGPQSDPDHPCGGLWDRPAGREAKRITDELRREALAGGTLTPPDYRELFRAILNRGEVRDPASPHPGVRIWGTMEARVQGSDLVILAGLNDGTWPELPAPDPWLNRKMRLDAGLLLPERRIGLSAHDFQQAICAREVVLSRSIRDVESETIASRWLLRLTNLLNGLPEGGEEIVKGMRSRGDVYLDLAARLDERSEGSLTPATRPCPRPPVETRPKRLSVTKISRLVRDPYSIYAESILKLRALDPLQRMPDAPLRGTVLHQIMEEFIALDMPSDHPEAHTRLLHIAENVLANEVPWPAARLLWRAKLERVLDQFLLDEGLRQADGQNLANEVRGNTRIDSLDFTLSATADRIDLLKDGGLAIYDYKSGTIPAAQAQKLFDKQLKLEAVIARAGGFDKLAPNPVSRVAYISLGKVQPFKPEMLSEDDITTTQDELSALIGAYQRRDQGYTALRLDPKLGYPSDFQHLSRFGEWDISQLPDPEEVG